MKINLPKTQLAARYALWLALFFLICIPALVFGLVSSIACWLSATLCDVADFAVVRGRELREQLR